MKWHRARIARRCGGCSGAIAEGAPMLLVTLADLVRCVACAKHQFRTVPPETWPDEPLLSKAPEPHPFTRVKRFDPKLAQIAEGDQ